MTNSARSFVTSAAVLAVVLLSRASGAEGPTTPNAAEEASERPKPEGDVAGELTVEVQGERPRRSSRTRTGASTVVRGEALDEPGVDAGRVIGRTVGAQTSRAGSSADLTTLSLRGSDSAQIPVYIAGIRVNDEVVGVADLSRIPLWMLDRVEVFRGTGPAHLDTLGLGGAVSFEPRVPNSSEVRGGGLFGSFETFGVWAGGTVVAPARVDGGLEAVTSVAYRHDSSASNFTYRDDGGTGFDQSDDVWRVRRNADFTSDDVMALSRVRIPGKHGASSLHFLFDTFAREQGVTGLSSAPATLARATQSRQLFGLTSSSPCRLLDSPCFIDATTSYHRGSLRTEDPRGELALGAETVVQRGDRSSTRLALRVEPELGIDYRLSAGFESARLRLDETEAARTRASETRVFASGDLTIELTRALVAEGAIRATCFDVHGASLGEIDGVDASLGECTPEGKLGLSLDVIPSLELRMNGAYSVRIPSLGERYGVSASLRGNPALEVESGASVDAGALSLVELGGHSRLSAELWGFARFARDLVALRRAALGYVRPYNVESARFLGAELDVEADLVRHFRIRTGLSALDPRDRSSERTTGNDLVPFRSQLTVSGEAEAYAELEGGGIERLGLVLYCDYRSGRVADPAGLIVIAEQVSFDLSVSALVLEGQLTLRARAENLFGAALYDAIGFPLPGRSFYVSAEGHLPD